MPLFFAVADVTSFDDVIGMYQRKMFDDVTENQIPLSPCVTLYYIITHSEGLYEIDGVNNTRDALGGMEIRRGYEKPGPSNKV